jgi:eukaryotic-like serine/threonine-protein kinase
MQFERLGPYQIGKRLGRGGMGAVFEGVNEETGEAAAIKILNPHLADDAGFRERFEIEINALKQLRHPNIVRMLGWGEQDGFLYYAMELVRGRSVEEELQAGRRFTWREVIQDAVKLAKAIRNAHDHGIVHRDLKPANILLTADDEDVKLTDFGIARLWEQSRLTMDGGLVGTAEFMSPEQASGDRVTEKSDLYSLGGVMFAMLAGRPPFRSGSLGEMLQKQRFEPPPPVTRFANDVPAEVEEIITRLLSKDPQARAPNALVLSRQLASMQHGLSILEQRAVSEATQIDNDSEDNGGPEPENHDPMAATQIIEQSPPGPPARPKDPTVADVVVAASSAAPKAKPVASPATPDDSDPFLKPEPGRPATIAENRFTTIEEDKRRAQELARAQDQGPAIIQIAVLALSLIAVVALLWYFTRPASADKLFARISAAAADDDPAALVAEQDEVKSFLDRFPDDSRIDDVRRYKDEIELERLEQRFRIRMRFPGRDDQLTSIEHDYIEAISTQTSDPQRSIAKLQALVDLYSPQAAQSETTSLCVELARRQLAHLHEQSSKLISQRLELLNSSLRRADALKGSNPVEARKIWQGILELYGDKSWAQAAVARARAGLSSMPETTSETANQTK